jgi:hypothetical protein
MKVNFEIPLGDDVKAVMRDIADKIKEGLAATGEGWHFALLLFREGTDTVCYIADVEREDSIEAFRMAIERMSRPRITKDDLLSPRDAIRFFAERGTAAAMSWLQDRPDDEALIAASRAAVDAGATPHEAALAMASLETYWLVKGS